MPETAEDTVRKEVLYPDELQGESFIVRGGPALPDEEGAKCPVYDAELDREHLPDDAKTGKYVPVERLYDEWTGWIAAPGAVRQWLADEVVMTGDAFHVVKCGREGDGTTPYEVDMELADEP